MNAPDAFLLAGELLRRIAAESKARHAAHAAHAAQMEQQMQTAQALRGHSVPPPPPMLDFGDDDAHPPNDHARP